MNKDEGKLSLYLIKHEDVRGSEVYIHLFLTLLLGRRVGQIHTHEASPTAKVHPVSDWAGADQASGLASTFGTRKQCFPLPGIDPDFSMVQSVV
jgi:hypothetical protein